MTVPEVRLPPGLKVQTDSLASKRLRLRQRLMKMELEKRGITDPLPIYTANARKGV